jgi:hypothetical protein
MQTACRYGWRRAALAVIAAYALALQALLAGAAAAAHLPGQGQAGWLCEPEHRDAPGPSEPAGSRAADCCTLACSGSPIGAPVRSAPDLRAAATWIAVDPAGGEIFDVPATVVLPLGARAPPFPG